MIDDRTDDERRNAHLGEVSANRSPKIVRGEVVNRERVALGVQSVVQRLRYGVRRAADQAPIDGRAACVRDQFERHAGQRDGVRLAVF